MRARLLPSLALAVLVLLGAGCSSSARSGPAPPAVSRARQVVDRWRATVQSDRQQVRQARADAALTGALPFSGSSGGSSAPAVAEARAKLKSDHQQLKAARRQLRQAVVATRR